MPVYTGFISEKGDVMLINRVKKEMSLKEIEKEEDVEIRLNKLHWFMKRKFIIGTIISILTFLLTIVTKAGAYRILSTQMPIFQVLVIIYMCFSITCLAVALIIKGIKEKREKHYYRWAFFYDLYNFFMECICVLLLIFTYLFAFIRVSGPSMKPTYKSNDILACRSIGYKPKNNDVVIVSMKEVETVGTNDLYVKRIVAVPGDTIKYDASTKTIYVNDVVVDREERIFYYDTYWITKHETYTLGEKEYFILGDNREVSEDSRVFGPVKRSDIVAKAMFNILFWR